MSITSQIVLDSSGQLSLLESGLWFGPFRKGCVFLLEKHSTDKGLYPKRESPRMAEFAWSDPAGKRPRVWVVEAKSSVARQDNKDDFQKNLEEWASKLANALTMIAGVKAGAFLPAADLSEVPEYVKNINMRDFSFYLVVVLTADWATAEACQQLQLCLRPYLSESLRAWGLPKDSVYVFNRELAQRKELTNGVRDSS